MLVLLVDAHDIDQHFLSYLVEREAERFVADSDTCMAFRDASA